MALKIDNSKGELVIDPYDSKGKWEKWKKTRILEGISAQNAKLLLKYLFDMEQGINISNKNKKGSRSYRRLVDLKNKVLRLIRFFEKELGIKDVTELDERQVIAFFSKMRAGKIKKKKGKGVYKTVGDYVKDFKAFWHWYMLYSKKERNSIIPDITTDLDASNEKPTFFYFTFEELKKLTDHSKYDYKVMEYFMFDSGLRSPTELMNVKVGDITPVPNSEFLWLNIRDETSKTFGRKIKLLICHHLLKDFLKNKVSEDFVFKLNPRVVNQYLNRLGEKVLDRKGLTMYDFRHSSACYWVPRYKSESALKYRFGWKKSDMIIYYTEFLGMKDTIQQDDMLIDVTKTEIEKELETEKRERLMLTEELSDLRKQLNKINSFMNELSADPDMVDTLAKKAMKHKVKSVVL